MSGFADILGGITKATEMVGAFNGAVNVLAPALQNVNMAVNNVAGVVNPGYNQDMYYGPPPGYYPPPNQMMPQPMPLGTDTSSPIGSIGNAIAGGVIGGLMGKNLANTIRPPKPPVAPTPPAPTPAPGGTTVAPSEIAATENISAKLSPNGKSIMMSGLKAGGIGAAVGGLFSGVSNFMKMSRNEITGGEATGNIVADTTVGFFSGIGGLATGTAAAMIMGGMGMASLPVTIGAAALGLVGAVATDFLFKKTGIRQSLADGVRNMVS